MHSPCLLVDGCGPPLVGALVHHIVDHFMLRAHLQSHLPAPWLGVIGICPEECVMSQLSKIKHSRDQWKEKAKQHGKGERYERREKARIKAERDQLTRTLKASQTRVRALEAQLNGLAMRPKVDVVHFALQLF
jgi:hypothetical protein